MRNVIAVVLGIISYTGLLFVFLGLSIRLVGIIPVMQTVIHLALIMISLEVAFRLSFVGAASIYTKAYALKILGVLMALVIVIFNLMMLGQASWIYHVIGVGFVIRVVVQGIRFGEPEYKTVSEVKKEIEGTTELTASEYTEIINESKGINKSNMIVGLTILLSSIIFSGVVSWIMFAATL